jgi:2',3'-cyclic-nucleotide 2'-phosphodiesterase (5'-nucleotidase family)
MSLRTRLLRSTFCVLRSALPLILVACASAPPRPARFKILQINDVYKIEGLEGGNSGGLARVRTLRRHLEEDGTPVLVLHGGDALYPSVMSKFLDAKPMVDVLNLLDGDAAAEDNRLVLTFGNHEFDKSDANVLLARLGESKFQWVATNTRWCNPQCDQRFPKVPDLYQIELAGVKIGIMGLLYPLQKSYVESTDVVYAARDAAQVLRQQGADVVIALTHQDMPDDVDLVKEVPGINLVIGGHDHNYMLDRVEHTWISKADADAKSVVVYDITVPKEGFPLRTTPLRVVLDTTIPKDKTVDAAVQKWLAALAEKLGGNETLGMTENVLEGVEPAVRGRETALGNLLADVMRETMQTDVAFMNGGGIRINDNIPAGPITTYDMEGIFYYDNDLVAVELTGQQLLDVLNNGVSRVDAGDGRFLQVSGVRFRYRKTADGYRVEDVSVGGKPLDPNAMYTASTVSFLYDSPTDDEFKTFYKDNPARPKEVKPRVKSLRAVTTDYITSRKTIDTEIEGRIEKVNH